MNKIISAILGISILLLISLQPSHANSIRDKVKSFTEMQQYVEKTDPSSTLLVMDDDDTLTMMSCPDWKKPETCQYLGGPAWFSWQQAQVAAMAQPRVANSFDQLLTASSLLFSINYMTYTAADVPVVLNKLVDSGVRLLAETARGNDNVSATERQFSRLNTNNAQYESLLSLINNHSLKFGKNGVSGKPSPYLPCSDKPLRAISYQQGAMYLSGQNKGIILKCMLDEYNAIEDAQPVSHVVFIDDTEENVINVQNAFANSDKYDVVALHYIALQDYKKALTEGKMAAIYQENAMKEWKAIKETLENHLQNPVLP